MPAAFMHHNTIIWWRWQSAIAILCEPSNSTVGAVAWMPMTDGGRSGVLLLMMQ